MKYLCLFIYLLSSCSTAPDYEGMRAKFYESDPSLVSSYYEDKELTVKENENSRLWFEKAFEKKSEEAVLFLQRQKGFAKDKVVVNEKSCQPLMSYMRIYFPTWMERGAFDCRSFKVLGAKKLLCTTNWKEDESGLNRKDYIIMKDLKSCEKEKNKF